MALDMGTRAGFRVWRPRGRPDLTGGEVEGAAGV